MTRNATKDTWLRATPMGDDALFSDLRARMPRVILVQFAGTPSP